MSFDEAFQPRFDLLYLLKPILDHAHQPPQPIQLIPQSFLLLIQSGALHKGAARGHGHGVVNHAPQGTDILQSFSDRLHDALMALGSLCFPFELKRALISLRTSSLATETPSFFTFKLSHPRTSVQVARKMGSSTATFPPWPATTLAIMMQALTVGRELLTPNRRNSSTMATIFLVSSSESPDFAAVMAVSVSRSYWPSSIVIIRSSSASWVLWTPAYSSGLLVNMARKSGLTLIYVSPYRVSLNTM